MNRRQWIVIVLIVCLLAMGCSTPAPEAIPKPTPTPVPTMSPEEEAAELARIEAELEVRKLQEKKDRVQDLKIVFLVPGTLEHPFNSLAYQGLQQAEAEYGTTIAYVEMGDNPKNWEKDFTTAVEADWDIIVTLNNLSSNKMTELVSMNASLYPDKRFIFLAGYGQEVPPNVVAINYNMNEATFLAGACAAMVTTSGMPLANEQPLIGFVGGMSIYVIKNQFMLGYIEGAKYINDDIKIMVSYTENFGKKSLGEKHAAKQYSAGVDIIFQAAGATGYGVINAAAAADRYVIGVDNDQAEELEAEYPEKAAHILTSVVRKYDGALFWVIDQYAADTLEFGREYRLGIAENAVGITKNSYYDLLDDEIKAQLADIESKITSKEINLDNLEGMEDAMIESLVESVKPE